MGRTKVTPAASAPVVHVFSCVFCSMRFSDYWYLERHTFSHTKERPYICLEPSCDASYNNPADLKAHQNWHRGVRSYHCPLCSESFFCRRTLFDHKRSKHGHGKRRLVVDGDDGVFEGEEEKKASENERCSECGKLLASKKALSNHRARVHREMEEMPHPCPEPGCGKGFCKPWELRRHLTRGHGAGTDSERMKWAGKKRRRRMDLGRGRGQIRPKEVEEMLKVKLEPELKLLEEPEGAKLELEPEVKVKLEEPEAEAILGLEGEVAGIFLKTEEAAPAVKMEPGP